MIEFLNRDEIINKKPSEVGMDFTKILDEYKKEVENYTEEQCKAEEERLTKIMDQWDAVLKDIKYDLPKEVASPAGQIVSRAKVGEYINDLLAKVECEFQYTLGYYQMYLWWKKPQPQIDYATCNSTLQVLGSGLRFRGPEQWQKILTINEYFKACHDHYAIDNMITYLYGSCHSALLDRMSLVSKAPDTGTPGEVEAEQGSIQLDGTIQ